MAKGCTVTCVCPEPPRYPDFEVEEVIVHTVWVTISGTVKVATYVPLPLSTIDEKVPPLLDSLSVTKIVRSNEDETVYLDSETR